MTYDLAIVGAGIVGLAHALAGLKRGLRVVVIDRDAQPNGASIRNFGLVTVTGQDSSSIRSRALVSREIWMDVAGKASIDVMHRGAIVAAQRPEAMAVLESYAATADGAECTLLTPQAVAERQPQLDAARLAGGLYSPYELRVESRDAVPRIVSYLASQGVEFCFSTAVSAVEPGVVRTIDGEIAAKKIVVCSGDDLTGLFADRIAKRRVQRCKLQMVRLADPGFRLSAAILSDLSLIRYDGYAARPEAAALKARLQAEQAEELANGIHLIVAQGPDGSLVIGDSHHYGPTPDPFGAEAVDRLIIGEFERLFGGLQLPVVARWVGTYASGLQAFFVDAPHPDVRLAMVTSGVGASIGFAIGEETVSELFG
ncbi:MULTISPECIES: TIGR03364 family FAD-dependent oxidoreductase [unclassified Aminobacter]|uniref:TIGR03364 family FAD-dependent oxidoreductase n=1 Tax=unclassified Aminobacter TaxID=2644704 RepID=UPI00046753B4|nr:MULTISPECIES: TIGR03364 family FAD-dependent oxidoreductase [unclassified Aminobacter]TWH28719.1 FAD dependent oxidoreductase TIGR03364 [Aminobacter sp. J15]